MDSPVCCESMVREDGTAVCASSTEASSKPKPTRCEMCEKAEAKYRCPGCLIRTCSLSCVQKHKSERHCNGERIKTAYVSIKEFTDANLLSDLHFLEEGSRKADMTRRDFHKYYPKAANFRLRTFVSNARNRGVDLLLMPSGMSRHIQNTSMYHFQSETIHWRVEWCFPQENLTFTDAGFSDAGLIQEGVDSHVKRHLEQTSQHPTACLAESQTSQPPPANPMSSESRGSEDVSRSQRASSEYQTLKCDREMATDEETMRSNACAVMLQYSAEGGRKYRVFLRVHGLEAAVQRYYELDKTLSLQKNLQGKRIIEFPTLYIVSEQCAHSYATLSADEERELTKTLRSTGRPYPKGHQRHGRGRGRRHRPHFYIDHKTKTTSWEDPRWSNKQQLATPFSAGQASNQGHGEAIQMRDMSHSPQHSPAAHRPHSPRHSPARHETTFSDQGAADLEAKVSRLHTLFPDAGPVIRDVLNMCGMDEDQAAIQLQDLGFEATRDTLSSRQPSHPSSSHTSPARKSATTTPTHRPGRQSGGASPARQQQQAAKASPAKPQITEAEKRKRKNKLCAEFKDLETAVVQMALESCHYDEDKVRATLSRVTSQWQSSSSGRRQTSASSGRIGSQRPTSPALPKQSDMEPVTFGISAEERLATSSSRPSRTSTPGRKETARSSAFSGQPKQHQQHRAKQVTKMSEQLLTTTNDLLNHLATSAASCCPDNQHSPQHTPKHSPGPASPHHSPSPSPLPSHSPASDRAGGTEGVRGKVVVQQPQAQPATRATVAHGAAIHVGSAGLALGPDPAMRVGPNHLLCNGPDWSLTLGGSMGAVGPNPDYHVGSVANLAIGSSGAHGPNPAQRCAAEAPTPVSMRQTYLQSSA